MYIYDIMGGERDITLVNEKKFTDEEFGDMYEKALLSMLDFYNIDLISDYLIDNYGFRDVKYGSTIMTI